LLQKYNIPSRTSEESKQTPDFIARQAELAHRYQNEYRKIIVKQCKWCGKDFEVDGEHKRKKYCSPECVSMSQKSKTKTQFCQRCGKEIKISSGRHYKRIYCDECNVVGRSEKQINKIQTTCGYCDAKIEVIPSVYKANRFCYCDMNCMAKHYAEIYSGENNPSWKGGKSHHYTGGFYNARQKARERDKYTCQICGITETDFGQQMSVHHIKNYRLFEDKAEANKLDNLICLCEPCHRFVHSNNNKEGLFINN